jgi:hypothetical protein
LGSLAISLFYQFSFPHWHCLDFYFSFFLFPPPTNTNMASPHETQLLQILSDTQSPAEGPRKAAEQHLQAAQNDPAFPSTLALIATHETISPEIRQAALLCLRTFVDKNWTGVDDDGVLSAVSIDAGVKAELRSRMLALATSDASTRKIKSAARFVVFFLYCIGGGVD